MKSINLTSLTGTTVLIVLICVGFWLYAEWDLKRFKESLPKSPPLSTQHEDAPAEQPAPPHKATETTEPMSSVPDAAFENSEPLDAEQPPAPDTVAVEETPTDTAGFDGFLDMFFEETATDSVTSEDFTDAQETPYDMEVVNAGFDDYNAYLQSDPEYAYQRLDDAFREQYGDDPDVDILVEMIRHGNEGSIPMDEAIEGADALIRLVSKISPPEAVEGLQVFREILMEGKQLALEEGLEVEYSGKYQIGE